MNNGKRFAPAKLAIGGDTGSGVSSQTEQRFGDVTNAVQRFESLTERLTGSVELLEKQLGAVLKGDGLNSLRPLTHDDSIAPMAQGIHKISDLFEVQIDAIDAIIERISL